MAIRNLNFGATLKFNSTGFQKGLNAALRSLENFRRDFLSIAGALGASIGLGGLVSTLKDTATQLSVARATLKNVSTGLGEYGDNLQWLEGLSKEYKQDILVLTDSFAKFHAASVGTNLTLEDQKKMFKELTMAATYFHMSGERTTNMLIAVEQMMSKGKVTAEELRRQLGNNLPGAVARMSKAAIELGKTTEGAAYKGIKSFADFEKAMKDGEIRIDVLQKMLDSLGKELEGNIDLNSLQLSLNELKNSWTEFVDSANVQDALSKLYSSLSQLLGWLTKNLVVVENAIISIAVGSIMGKLIPAIGKIATAFTGLAWGTWVGVIIAAFTSVIQVIAKLEKKIGDVNKKLKQIKDTNDIYAKYELLKETEAEFRAFVEDPKKAKRFNNEKSRKVWENYKRLEQSDSPTAANARQRVRSGNWGLIEYWKKLEALPGIQQEMRDIEQQIKNEGTNTGTTIPNGTSSTSGKKPKTVKDYIEEYEEGVKKLKNQLDAESITTEEYTEKLDKLAESTWQNITAFDDFRTLLSELPDTAELTAEKLEEAFTIARARKAQKDAEKAAKEVADKWEKYNSEKSDRKFKARDTRFDYRSEDYEILRAEGEQWEQIVSDLESDKKYLEDNFEKMGEAAVTELAKVNKALEWAQKHVTDLKDAADIAEWRAEIEKLTEESWKTFGQGVKGTAQDIDRLTTGWKQMKETLEDADASDWDKFISILNEMVQMFETINGLVETFNTLEKISAQFERAKNAEELASLAEKQTAEAAVIAAKGSELALTHAATVAEGKEAATAISATAAKSGEAIAGATKSGAALPFPANIAAIAAGVAAVVAALSMIKGFANGGVVGGNGKHGDHNLVLANQGEMFISGVQQKRLWNFISGKSSAYGIGSAPEITFRLRGQDIIGAIQNTNAKRRG